MLSKSEIDNAVSKSLESIDDSINWPEGNIESIKNYYDTVGVHNIQKGGVKGRIIRKSLLPFEKLIKKLFQGYFDQRTLVDNYIMLTLNHQQRELSIIRNNPQLNSELKQLMDEKIFETHKLIAGFKREVLAELVDLKGGPIEKQAKIITKIINKEKTNRLKKLNVGSGVDTRDDFINVDHRAIEGVDVVADVLDMPFSNNSLEEIFAAHLAEHFIERDFARVIQYWYGLLKNGGQIRLVVPNIEAMSRGYASGSVTWDQLRAVSLGGQDYASDYHFNHFSVDSMRNFITRSLPEAEFSVIEPARRNGDCLEMEVLIKKKK